jgi:hypothetical protein
MDTSEIKTAMWGARAPKHGDAPSIVLCNPKYADNVGKIVRFASCYGLSQVWWTGERVSPHLVEQPLGRPRDAGSILLPAPPIVLDSYQVRDLIIGMTCWLEDVDERLRHVLHPDTLELPANALEWLISLSEESWGDLDLEPSGPYSRDALASMLQTLMDCGHEDWFYADQEHDDERGEDFDDIWDMAIDAVEGACGPIDFVQKLHDYTFPDKDPKEVPAHERQVLQVAQPFDKDAFVDKLRSMGKTDESVVDWNLNEELL